MKKHSLIFHPITIFLFSFLGPFLALFVFLHWFVQFNEINSIKHCQTELSPLLNWNPTLVFMIAGSMLCFTVLGLTLIFKYFHKIHQLYNLQETFLSSFTHELKTPLASIKLYLETFLRHDLTKEEQNEFIQFMLGDIKRLSNNVQQILQIGRLENKQYKYAKDQVNLDKYIRDFISNNQSFFRSEQGGEIHYHNNCTFLPFYPINVTLFEILLMNMISNAFKYNDGSRPEVDITVESNKRYLQLIIKDNGVGLEKKDFKTIFNKFYQVHRDGQYQTKGTGLGLYIAKQIVQIHQGKMSVTSSGLGKGCCFTISLPYNKKRPQE